MSAEALAKDEQRARWGRIGGLRNKARHGGHAMTAAAVAGFRAKFEDCADPDAALRAHMLELAEKSALARRKAGRAIVTPRPAAATVNGHDDYRPEE